MGMRYNAARKSITVITQRKEVIALPDEPGQALKTLIVVFREKLGLRSPRDIAQSKADLEVVGNTTNSLGKEWHKITPKSLKDSILMDYVRKLKEKYELNRAQTLKLISALHLAIQFKTILPADIVFEDGVIKDIKKLTYNPDAKKFETPDHSAVEKKKTEKVVVSKKVFTAVNRFHTNNKMRLGKFSSFLSLPQSTQ